MGKISVLMGVMWGLCCCMDAQASVPEASGAALPVNTENEDVESYLKLNPDIEAEVKTRHFDPEKFAKLHFVTHGRAEGRPYLTQKDLARLPADFNPQTYLNTHADVKVGAAKRGSDLETYAKYHYLKVGMAEGLAHKEPLILRGASVPGRQVMTSEEGQG